MKILTITLNPAIDLTLELDTLQVGAVNRQQHSQTHAAGKGLNVAQVLKDLGHQVIVSGFLGSNNRQLFDAHCQAQGFDNRFVYVAGDTRQNIKIAEQSGQMTDINGIGFSVTDANKAALQQQLEAISTQYQVVVIAGSLPLGFSAQELAALITDLKAAGKWVAVDSSGPALAAAIAAKPWMIKPNSDELFESYQMAANSYRQQRALIASVKADDIQHICISMGENGVHWLSKTQDWHASAPKVVVKSTVGAGDALLAGMIHGQLTGLSATQCLKTATAIASYAVSQIGFGVADMAQIEALKQQIVVTALSLQDE